MDVFAQRYASATQHSDTSCRDRMVTEYVCCQLHTFTHVQVFMGIGRFILTDSRVVVWQMGWCPYTCVHVYTNIVHTYYGHLKYVSCLNWIPTRHYPGTVGITTQGLLLFHILGSSCHEAHIRDLRMGVWPALGTSMFQIPSAGIGIAGSGQSHMCIGVCACLNHVYTSLVWSIGYGGRRHTCPYRAGVTSVNVRCHHDHCNHMCTHFCFNTWLVFV